jgi:aminopeptidase
VIESGASEGEGLLHEMLAMDDGARRVGEFAFGMNDAVQEFTGHTLFDEKIGGTMHLALGKSYPESGGVNQSALHWDLVCDLRGSSEVYADGELVYRDGRFLEGVL